MPFLFLSLRRFLITFGNPVEKCAFPNSDQKLILIGLEMTLFRLNISDFTFSTGHPFGNVVYFQTQTRLFFAFGNAHHTDKTIDCAASTGRSELIKGSEQPSEHCAAIPAVYMWLPCGQLRSKQNVGQLTQTPLAQTLKETRHHPNTHTSMDDMFTFSLARSPLLHAETCENSSSINCSLSEGCVIAVGSVNGEG